MSESRIQTFVESVKLVLKKEFPDVVGPFRYPAKAAVLRVRPGNLVDLQLLASDGNPEPDAPPLPMVPLPAGITEIHTGQLVRVGFYYNDPAQVFIEAIL